jgi:carboxylesterase type B
MPQLTRVASQFYTWKNVRFGKAPTGDLRFRASEYPDKIPNPDTLQPSTYGPTCFQVNTSGSCAPHYGLKDTLDLLPPIVGEQSEDCLFLDLYVPRAVFHRQTPPAAVVVWIFGGAYVYGGKSAFGPTIPFYNGTGLEQVAALKSQNIVFVAGNYRIGAFGWLAGTTMEQVGTPNAGLYDQRLLFQWVQDFIHLVNGDRTQVSAWGESAGAGSIMHQLVANWPDKNPLFTKALVQSPAFPWGYDRTGTLEQIFVNFTKLADCPPGNITCLRAKTSKELKRANELLFETGTKCTGVFDLGPAVDGKLITELPAVSLANGELSLSPYIRGRADAR